jgi:protein-tyrosine phosphatase
MARILPLVGAYNFRDLGGYPTADGRRTRWGRVFRSDTLGQLTDADLTLLRGMGLATVVDLRTAAEVERDGRVGLGDEHLAYVNLSVLPEEGGESVAAPAEGTDMSERYLWYLEAGRSPLATALTMVADDRGHPLVFHCTAGKDRTGVLSALVLSCLGVEREAVVDDYVQTAARLDLILQRLRRHPVYGPAMAEAPPTRYRVEAPTMERFLDGLEARFGGAAGWALSSGVTAETLAGMSEALLEDDV